MLTKQEWWNNMVEYNALIFPGQYIMLAIAAIIVLFIIRAKVSSKVVKNR